MTRRLHELLDPGELGEPRHVEVETTIPAPADDDPRWDLKLAGGALMDLGCYSLHAYRILTSWAGSALASSPRVAGNERATPRSTNGSPPTSNFPAGQLGERTATWPDPSDE